MTDKVLSSRSRGRSEIALDALCAARRTNGGVLRVTIVCAHPDDEVIGAAGRLPHLRELDIVHVTDGAPRDMTDAIACGLSSREAYARVRAAERARALALAAVSADRIRDIGLVDQEASFALVGLTRCLVDRFTCDGPDVVLTHPYEGGHPDHDATAFAVHAAVAIVRDRQGGGPTIVEFTGYHWRDGEMRTGCFLSREPLPMRRISLSREERRLKEAMFACYETQQRVLAAFPVDAESFREAPAYDFTAPPHEGRLFYEWFDWGVTGDEWRRLARASRTKLGRDVTPC